MKKHLINHLKELVNSLENNWIDEKAVYRLLLVVLISSVHLKLEKKYYIEEVNKTTNSRVHCRSNMGETELVTWRGRANKFRVYPTN